MSEVSLVDNYERAKGLAEHLGLLVDRFWTNNGYEWCVKANRHPYSDDATLCTAPTIQSILFWLSGYAAHKTEMQFAKQDKSDGKANKEA